MAKMSKKQRVLQDFEPWLTARRRFRLSDAHVQMARELGLNPKKLGKLANHEQEPWKLPLPLYLEELYRKRFNRDRPERVVSLEQRAAEIARKAEEKRARKQLRREARDSPVAGPDDGSAEAHPSS